MHFVELKSTDSTNSYARREWDNIEKPALISAYEQYSGKGQRGNHWESETGKNLTVSLMFEPEGLGAADQFNISIAVSLAVVDLLSDLGIEAKVKWPNDIYVGDRKIAGILIENSILGKEITRCVAGIGLNLNQTEFVSDAPNPVSVKMLLGRDTDISEAPFRLWEKFERRIPGLRPLKKDADIWGKNRAEYLTLLWRGDGQYYPFYDTILSERIEAKIGGVSEEGFLKLITKEGEEREYAFKQVQFLIEN